MSKKLYSDKYVPPVPDDKPVVSPSKKTAVLNKMKAHMGAENRGYDLRELIRFVQAELHKTHLHVRDDEVAKWIEKVDEEWGWHPELPEPAEIEEK